MSSVSLFIAVLVILTITGVQTMEILPWEIGKKIDTEFGCSVSTSVIVGGWFLTTASSIKVQIPAAQMVNHSPEDGPYLMELQEYPFTPSESSRLELYIWTYVSFILEGSALSGKCTLQPTKMIVTHAFRSSRRRVLATPTASFDVYSVFLQQSFENPLQYYVRKGNLVRVSNLLMVKIPSSEDYRGAAHEIANGMLLSSGPLVALRPQKIYEQSLIREIEIQSNTETTNFKPSSLGYKLPASDYLTEVRTSDRLSLKSALNYWNFKSPCFTHVLKFGLAAESSPKGFNLTLFYDRKGSGPDLSIVIEKRLASTGWQLIVDIPNPGSTNSQTFDLQTPDLVNNLDRVDLVIRLCNLKTKSRAEVSVFLNGNTSIPGVISGDYMDSFSSFKQTDTVFRIGYKGSGGSPVAPPEAYLRESSIYEGAINKTLTTQERSSILYAVAGIEYDTSTKQKKLITHPVLCKRGHFKKGLVCVKESSASIQCDLYMDSEYSNREACAKCDSTGSSPVTILSSQGCTDQASKDSVCSSNNFDPTLQDLTCTSSDHQLYPHKKSQTVGSPKCLANHCNSCDSAQCTNCAISYDGGDFLSSGGEHCFYTIPVIDGLGKTPLFDGLRPCAHEGCTKCSLDYSHCANCDKVEGCEQESQACPIYCDTCAGFGHCTACKQGYYMNPDTRGCSTCTTAGYSIRDNMCVSDTCNTSCKTCTPSNTNTCLTCKTGDYILENKLCGNCDIQNGFFLDYSAKVGEIQCHSCHTTCKTCSGSLDNQCTSCPLNKYLFEDGRCGDCDTSQSPFYKDTSSEPHRCLRCHSSCQTCSGSSENQCTSCPLNKYLFEDGRCGDCDTNQSPFYKDTSSEPHRCLRCHSSCQTCSGPSDLDCLNCENDFFFDPETKKCLGEILENGIKAFFKGVLDLTFNQNPKNGDEDFSLIVSPILPTLQDLDIRGPAPTPHQLLDSIFEKISKDLLVSQLGSDSTQPKSVLQEVTVLEVVPSSQIFNYNFKTKFEGFNFSLTIENKGSPMILVGQRAFRLMPFSSSFPFVNITNLPSVQDEIKSATSKGTVVGALAAGIPMKSQSAIESFTAVSSSDPSGTLTRFSQSVKLFNRIYFLNLKKGLRFNNFLKGLESFSKTHRQDMNLEYIEAQRRYNGLIHQEGVLADFASRLHWKIALYFCSWIIKEVNRHVVVFRLQPSRLVIIFLFYWPTIHLILLNMVLIDFAFYAPIAAFLSKYTFSAILSYLVLISLMIDILQMVTAALDDRAWTILFQRLTLVERLVKKKEAELKNSPQNQSQFNSEPNSSSDNLKNQSIVSSEEQSSQLVKEVPQEGPKPEPTEAISKVLDYDWIFCVLDANFHVANHLSGILRIDPQVFASKACRLTGIYHFIRLGLYQTFIVGGQYCSKLILTLLVVLEIFKLATMIHIQVKHKAFRHFVIFLTQFLQSFEGLILMTICFRLSYFKTDEDVPDLIQTVGIYLIMGSVALEYLLLFPTVLVAIQTFLRTRRLEKKLTKDAVKTLWFIKTRGLHNPSFSSHGAKPETILSRKPNKAHRKVVPKRLKLRGALVQPSIPLFDPTSSNINHNNLAFYNAKPSDIQKRVEEAKQAFSQQDQPKKKKKNLRIKRITKPRKPISVLPAPLAKRLNEIIESSQKTSNPW